MEERIEQRRSPLLVFLDRTIVVLMTAILLTMSWPVCLILWQQTHVSGPVAHVETAPSRYPPPAPRQKAQEV